MPRVWSSDVELFQAARESLFTAVLGDILDALGFLHQFLPPHIKPLRQDMVVVGRAMTVLEADYFGLKEERWHNPLSERPFGLMLEALDDLKANEVYVATGGSARYALWGELMSTRAAHLGAAGAVLDGYSRDSLDILRLGFPTFSHGGYAQDQGPRGKVVDFRIPVEIGGVRVESGDIVFGDVDGVIVVPRAVEHDAFSQALEKVEKESLVREAIGKGMSASEAFKRYGVM
jgi:4-hydroxy-4-methyl-2-oxoglutarate aldolase